MLFRSKKIRIGVITQLAKSSFVKTIHAGIDKAEQELEEFGVEIIRKQIDGVSEDAQLEALEELSQERIDGLAIMPVQSERIREKLNDMAEQNDLPIITFNSDIVGTNRVCYVGLDNDRDSKYFESNYSLRTECERYNSRFKNTGQERMWVRNKASVTNLNTLAHISLLAVAVAAITSHSGQSYRKLKTIKRIA